MRNAIKSQRLAAAAAAVVAVAAVAVAVAAAVIALQRTISMKTCLRCQMQL